MWFLYYYLISTIVVITILFIITTSIKNKIKREHPEALLIPKSSRSERIADILPMFIPFINILLILIMIFTQDIAYEKTLEKLLEKKNNK